MSSAVAFGDSVAALSPAQKYEPRTTVTNHNKTSFPHDEPGAGGPKKKSAPERDSRAVAEQVLRAFNTWAFKREQPSDPQLMLQTIADAVSTRAPIPFVLYWGKGPRHTTAAPEVECLGYLDALVSRVRGVHAPGAAMTLILTDTHATLNGHSRENIDRYFADLEILAAQHGFRTCRLNELVKAAGNLATAAPLEDVMLPDVLASLTASARKWYRGPGTPEEGALAYLRINLIEQRVVERAFPRAIFITFNGSDLRSLFPRQLPVFYMYSLRRGFSVKPWFLPADHAAPVSGDPVHDSSRLATA